MCLNALIPVPFFLSLWLHSSVCHYAHPTVSLKLQEALSEFRFCVSDLLVTYKYKSIREYVYSFMAARILSGQDDPTAWATEDRRCFDLLIHKMPTTSNKPYSGTLTTKPSSSGVASGASGTLYTCNNFNAARCDQEPCKFKHSCNICQQGHPAIACKGSGQPNQQLQYYSSWESSKQRRLTLNSNYDTNISVIGSRRVSVHSIRLIRSWLGAPGTVIGSRLGVVAKRSPWCHLYQSTSNYSSKRCKDWLQRSNPHSPKSQSLLGAHSTWNTLSGSSETTSTQPIGCGRPRSRVTVCVLSTRTGPKARRWLEKIFIFFYFFISVCSQGLWQLWTNNHGSGWSHSHMTTKPPLDTELSPISW